MKKRGWPYWRNIIILSLATLMMGLFFTFYVALPIIYANGIAHPKRSPVCCVTPEDFDLPYENVAFKTAEGIILQGWYIPSENGAAIIVSHGIGGNRTGHLEQGAYLAKNGFGVLLFDSRAHGESGGDQVTFGGNDIIAALDYLQTRDDIDPQRIGALGISLGGLTTLQAAAVRQDIQAIAADGSAANKIRDLPKPPTFEHWLDLPFQIVTYWVWEYKGVTASHTTIEAIEKIAPRPILLIAGAKSEYEVALHHKLFRAANEPKTLWVSPEAGHAESWCKNPEAYQEKLLLLFEQALLAGE